MAFTVTAPIVSSFILEHTDRAYPSDDSTVISVRQATKAQDIIRSAMFSEVQRVFRDGDDENEAEVVFKQDLNMAKLQQREVYLTLCDCNIIGLDGKQLFKFKKDNGGLDMSFKEFCDAWGVLPSLICDEIHGKVLDVNITWSGRSVDSGN